MSLTVVPTPIGNLEDITLRGLRALRTADIIACEDTRRTRILCTRYALKKPLLSYHEHNERGRTEQILQRLREGQKVALVSDAGTPGISDPGAILINAVIAEGLPLEILPGATALIPGLLYSGLSSRPFLFAGFLNDKASSRRKEL
ncbi:MAG TPA: rRNA small subunit methyltransferase 1, partial [Synergistaceae bacterium]|nr:rRNA small subunit methyltransferase 1 [Synergistaceae bacterium]